MKKTYQITEAGKADLEKELAELKGRRGEIAEKIAAARDFGIIKIFMLDLITKVRLKIRLILTALYSFSSIERHYSFNILFI